MTKAGKGLSIGAAMKNRMQGGGEDAPQVQAASAETAPVEELESFNTRLPRGLHRRLKMHAAGEGRKIQDVVSAALEEYLGKKESQTERK